MGSEGGGESRRMRHFADLAFPARPARHVNGWTALTLGAMISATQPRSAPTDDPLGAPDPLALAGGVRQAGARAGGLAIRLPGHHERCGSNRLLGLGESGARAGRAEAVAALATRARRHHRHRAQAIAALAARARRHHHPRAVVAVALLFTGTSARSHKRGKLHPRFRSQRPNGHGARDSVLRNLARVRPYADTAPRRQQLGLQAIGPKASIAGHA